MPLYSLNARREFNAESAGIVPIVLVRFTHPILAAPVYLSSDPTERFSADPLAYGTTSGGNQWFFVLMSVFLPDEQRGVVAGGQFIIDNIENRHSEVVRSFGIIQATADLYLAFTNNTNNIERTYSGLSVISAEYDAQQVKLSFERSHMANEPFPPDSMNWLTFPGLFAGTTR